MQQRQSSMSGSCKDLTTHIWEEMCRSCTSPHYLPLTCSLKIWSALFYLLKWSVISQVFCTISLQMEETIKYYRHSGNFFFLFWQMVKHHLRGKRWVDVFSHLNKPNTKHFYSLSKRLWICLISMWLLASTASWNGFDQWFSLYSVCILIISQRVGVKKKEPSKFFVSAFKLIWKLKYWARLFEKRYRSSFLSAFYFILFQIKRQSSSPTVEFKWIQSFTEKKTHRT